MRFDRLMIQSIHLSASSSPKLRSITSLLLPLKVPSSLWHPLPVAPTLLIPWIARGVAHVNTTKLT